MTAYKAHLVARRVYDETYAAYIAAGADHEDANEAAEWAAGYAYDSALDEEVRQ